MSAPPYLVLLICLSWKIPVFNWIYSAYHALEASEIVQVYEMRPLCEQKTTPTLGEAAWVLGSAIRQGNVAVGENSACRWDCTSVGNRAVVAGDVFKHVSRSAAVWSLTTEGNAALPRCSSASKGHPPGLPAF